MTTTALFAASASPSDFTGLVGWVVDVVATGGPVGVAFLLALDNVLPVVPSEVVLPFAGYLTASGELSFWVVLLAATVGSTAVEDEDAGAMPQRASGARGSGSSWDGSGRARP